jgi:hypothetical protein
MDTSQPISSEELDVLLAVQIGNCSPEQRELFERCKVTPYLVPINRIGKVEAVFVVASVGDIVLYYEDIEEGFNISSLLPDGSIATPGYEQWELGHALGHLAAT